MAGGVDSIANLWRPFVFDEKNFLLKIEKSAKVCLTDLKSVWLLNSNPQESIQLFKEMNPLYGGNDDEIFTEILKHFQELKQVSSLKEIQDLCQVEIKWTIKILPVSIKFSLRKGDADMYFKEVTIPLMKTIQFLELQHDKMSELLQKKDLEIQEYTIEFNAEISLKTLITPKYVKETKIKRSGLMLNVFTKSGLFEENIGEQCGDVKEVYPELEMNQVERKTLQLPKKKKPKTH